jgi:hypothetical protein
MATVPWVDAAVRDLGIDRTEAQRSIKIASLAPAFVNCPDS